MLCVMGNMIRPDRAHMRSRSGAPALGRSSAGAETEVDGRNLGDALQVIQHVEQLVAERQINGLVEIRATRFGQHNERAVKQVRIRGDGSRSVALLSQRITEHSLSSSVTAR